jgi:hypothetical protein
MRVTIHQPNFLPWLGFFAKASRADLLVLLDNVQFIKRGFIQRNYVKAPDDKRLIGVPVVTKGRYYQTIAETEINHDTQWQSKILGTLRHLYSKAPAFADRAPDIQCVLTRRYDRLVELNTELLTLAFRYLGVTTPVIRASELTGVEGMSTDRLIAICHAVSADEYLSGAGGRNYQDEAAFEAAGIRLVYSDFEHPVYPQLHGDFMPCLSVIDYLFNVPSAEALFRRAPRAA